MIGHAYFIICAYILDCIIGDPRWIPHPVIYMGKAIHQLERWVRHMAKTPRQLKAGGFLLPLVLVVGACALTWGVLRLLSLIHPAVAAIFEVILIATTIATKGLKDAGMEVYRHLQAGNMPEARKALGMIVGRDTEHLDEPEIVRGTVETVAENIVDAIISPLFYAAIGGAPLAIAYRAVNTLDSMVGYKNEKYENLGFASARLDDLANWIPARITAVLLVFVAWLLRLDARRAWRTVRRDAKEHPSPNSGYPESAVAGALGVRLGGHNVYKGIASFRAYMGEPVVTLRAEHIRGTTWLMYGSSALFAVLTALLLWVISVLY
ncbi:adenosylcobinamide-phosphate synthase CbiB [Paenibacillus selenitireducens]